MSTKSCFSIFTLILTFLTVFVAANDTLLLQICSKTNNPKFCTSCLQADPKHGIADAKGLAKISVSCGEVSTKLLYDIADSLYVNGSIEANVRSAVKKCESLVDVAVKGFGSVYPKIDQKDNIGAKTFILQEIAPYIDRCLMAFKTDNVPAPIEIPNAASVASDSCKLATQILSII